MLNIKKYREKMGISQAELSRRIGVSRQTFNNYELGKREADYETLLKIAEELHTSVQALLTDENLESQNGIVLEKNNIYMIPIFKTVSAGFGAYADDQICGYEPLYLESQREAEETLAIAVKGSRIPLFR